MKSTGYYKDNRYYLKNALSTIPVDNDKTLNGYFAYTTECKEGEWVGIYYGLTEKEYKEINGATDYPIINDEPLSNYKFIIRKK